MEREREIETVLSKSRKGRKGGKAKIEIDRTKWHNVGNIIASSQVDRFKDVGSGWKPLRRCKPRDFDMREA